MQDTAAMTVAAVYRQGLPRQHAARVTSPAGGQFTARLDTGTVSWAEPDVWAFPEKHGLYRYYCPGHNGGVCQYGMCDETRVRDLAELGRAVSEFERVPASDGFGWTALPPGQTWIGDAEILWTGTGPAAGQRYCKSRDGGLWAWSTDLSKWLALGGS